MTAMAPSSETSHIIDQAPSSAFLLIKRYDTGFLVQSSRDFTSTTRGTLPGRDSRNSFLIHSGPRMGGGPSLGFTPYVRQFLLKLTEDLYTRKLSGRIIISPYPTQKSSKQREQESLADKAFTKSKNTFARNGNP